MKTKKLKKPYRAEPWYSAVACKVNWDIVALNGRKVGVAFSRRAATAIVRALTEDFLKGYRL